MGRLIERLERNIFSASIHPGDIYPIAIFQVEPTTDNHLFIGYKSRYNFYKIPHDCPCLNGSSIRNLSLHHEEISFLSTHIPGEKSPSRHPKNSRPLSC